MHLVPVRHLRYLHQTSGLPSHVCTVNAHPSVLPYTHRQGGGLLTGYVVLFDVPSARYNMILYWRACITITYKLSANLYKTQATVTVPLQYYTRPAASRPPSLYYYHFIILDISQAAVACYDTCSAASRAPSLYIIYSTTILYCGCGYCIIPVLYYTVLYFAAPCSYQRLAPPSSFLFSIYGHIRPKLTLLKHSYYTRTVTVRSDGSRVLSFDSASFLPIYHNPITNPSCYQEFCLL